MRRALAASALMIAVLLLAVPAPGNAQSEPTTATPAVEAAVQVTADPSGVRGHAIPSVAVHPRDPKILAIAEGDAYSHRCAVHVSTDGGRVWRASEIALPPEWPECGFSTTGTYADVAFGPQGSLYVGVSGFEPSTYKQRILLARSTDLGRTWQLSELPSIDESYEKTYPADAMPSVAADPQNPQRVHLAWWSNNGTWNMSEKLVGDVEWCTDLVPRAWLATSNDAGRTFSQPVDLAGDIEGCMTEPYIVTGNGGEVYAFFGEASKSEEGAAPVPHLYFAASRDGGRTFQTKPIFTSTDPDEGFEWLSAPSPGIDRRTGALYVVWEEMGEGPVQFLFMSSRNGGRTWSEPVKVNDVDPQREWESFTDSFPSLSVAPNGRIDVAWYDYRNDYTYDPEADENSLQDVYYAYSRNGGRTWSENIRVTDRIIDRRFGPRSVGFITGPVGLASTDEAAYVAWDDTRAGNEENGSQDIYFTRVAFPAAADVTATSADTGTKFAWAILGAAAGLIVAGLALLLGLRAARGTRQPAAGELVGPSQR